MRAVLERCAELREKTDGYFDARYAGKLDPSGLVKGWAVDRAAAILDEGGVRNYAVSAGGDMRVRGGALPDPAWRIGIQHPHRRDQGADAGGISEELVERQHHECRTILTQAEGTAWQERRGVEEYVEARGVSVVDEMQWMPYTREVGLCGEREQFSTEYPCHAPHEQRWFISRVTRFRNKGVPRILIEHINSSREEIGNIQIVAPAAGPNPQPFVNRA